MTQELQSADAGRIHSIMATGAPGSSLWSLSSILEEMVAGPTLARRNENREVDAFIFLRDVVDAYEISYLATHPQARHKGLMRALLTRATSFAAGAGRPVWLEVHEQNQPARKLYEAAGFRVTGRRPKYYADGATAILYTFG